MRDSEVPLPSGNASEAAISSVQLPPRSSERRRTGPQWLLTDPTKSRPPAGRVSMQVAYTSSPGSCGPSSEKLPRRSPERSAKRPFVVPTRTSVLISGRPPGGMSAWCSSGGGARSSDPHPDDVGWALNSSLLARAIAGGDRHAGHPLPDLAPTLSDVAARLPALIVRDGQELRRRLDRARRDGDEASLRALVEAVEAAEHRLAQRRARVPDTTYPEGLPVSERKDELVAAVRDNQVVIVAGETGSGKSTQLPKICLEAGQGVRGLIGHTQPRRIAARTIAERVAEELGGAVGEVVGYTVRFTDKVGDRTLVRVMTDGILLAEIQRDRELSRYDTVIVDEAHERSLNIDFILGYLKQLLPRRPDLKVIVT